MTLTINGIKDYAGNLLANSTTHFTTSAGPDITPPFVVYSSPDSNSSSNVPVNSTLVLQFSEPMDSNTTLGNILVYDYSIGYIPSASLTKTLSADGLTAMITPNSSLPTSRQFQLSINNALDMAGNVISGYAVSFTTSAATDTTAPTVTAVNPGNATTGVPINPVIQIQFSESIQTASTGSITLSSGGNLPVSLSFGSGNQVVQLTTNTTLQPNTSYTITITGVRDVAGNTMAGSVVVTFTTGAGASLTQPSAQTFNPVNGAINVPTSVTPTVTFSAPINPVSAAFNGVRLRLHNTQALVPFTLSFSADYRTVTITPNSALTAATFYDIYILNVTDQAGNIILNNGVVSSFTTN
jgi:hypothetical protein